MALEVGRLVARIDIEGSFEAKIAAAKTAMEDAAKSAAKFDDAMSKAGKSGAKLDVPTKAKDTLDKTASAASKASDSISKAAETGKKLDVSDAPKKKLDDAASSATKAAGSMQKASDTGKKMQVSDQPRQKLAETASFADQLDAKLGHVGLSLAKLKTAGTGLAIGATLFAGLDRVKAIDTAQGKLRGLGHEAASVTEIMNSATESVTGTAYGLGDAATIAANAVAAGIKPGKDLTKYLTMTADASAIAGVSLGEMGRILNQVQTGQSAYAGDLSQLADRGIPIYQWLADEAGVAAEEIKGMASKGQVSSEMLFSAIQNNIGGAAQEMGGTLVGSIANVGAAFGRLGASAIDPFKDDIMAASEGAQKFAGALSGVVGPAAGVAASALSGVAKVIGVIPTPILAATGALIALQKTGLGDTLALKAMYAGDAIKNLGSSMGGVNGFAGTMKSGLKGIVDMLGGPLMIGLAGATVAVTDIIGSIQRASAAQNAISESAARAAGAHLELASAVAEANGAMSEQAVAAAQSIIEESITSTGAAAEQASGMFAGLGNWIDQTTMGYDGMKGAIDGNVSAMDRSRLEGRVNEMQMEALKEAAGSLGIEMDRVAGIAQAGGPRWLALKDAMAEIGPEGEDMAIKLQAAADAAEATAEAARRIGPEFIALQDALGVLGDAASSADEKLSAMRTTLEILGYLNTSAAEKTSAVVESISKLGDVLDGTKVSADEFDRVFQNADGSLNVFNENTHDLNDALTSVSDRLMAVSADGGDVQGTFAAMQPELEALRNQAERMGLDWDGLLGSFALTPDAISIMAEVHGLDQVEQDLLSVHSKIKDAEVGAEIPVRLLGGQESIDEIDRLGGKVKWIDEATGEALVTVKSDQFKTDLSDANGLLTQLDNRTTMSSLLVDGTQANRGIDEIFAELAALDEAESNPALGLVIDDFLAGRDISHAELDALHSRVVDPQARLLIEQLMNESSRANADLDNTARPRTATITAQLDAGSLTGIQSTLNSMSFTVPVSALPSLGGFADGGFTPSWSFADGGMKPNGTLPDQAKIQRPAGTSGLVQWAEAETGGEAFIPLAPSKRKRSLDIWRETGRRLGVFANGGMLPAGDGTRGDMGGILGPLFGKFADGGITVSGLVNLARGVEGAPYVWGGVNWGDCSGAVSALANYVSGRSPFGSRFATGNEGQALAERGFKPGRGKKGDLQIGWFNGGPYGGHTSATLPNGTNFEMGGGRGNGQYGGSAAGANSGQHTNHAHFPAEKFADAATLGGAAVDNRTPRQKNIDAIVAEGQRRNLSDRDIQIALMTAEQESGIRVLANPADAASMGMANEGVGYDHDSTGIFQQRNNGAWGTLADRMDPTKSSAMFYDELEKIEGRDSMALTAVAQKVQGSAHPDAYAKHEGKASEELAASKARLESLSKSGGGSGSGQKVFVTNWPSGGGSYSRSSSSSDAIDDAKDAVADAQQAAWVQDQSIAAMVAHAAGRSDLIQVEAFANGGFHGVENHSAHIAPAGSYRLFGESETGGEAYIPLASHKRARSTQILAETARRMGYSIGAGVNLVGSVLTGNGLDTGWGGPGLADLGIDTGALRDSLSPGVTAEAERAGQQIAAILQNLGATVDQQVEGTLSQVNDGKAQLRQQYSRAMI